MDDKGKVYVSNIQILYNDLQKAINEYINSGHIYGEVKYINAYLMAVLGAIAVYKDTVKKDVPETDEIKACKYANNMLKHEPTIITHIEPEGGISFPISFPVAIEQIDIVWKWQDLNAYHQNQKKAFKDLFAGKPVLNTLNTVLSQLNIEVPMCEILK